MNAAYPDLPWVLTFSFGRALQASALKLWGGDMSAEAKAKAQGKLLERATAELSLISRVSSARRETGSSRPMILSSLSKKEQ